jgi:potassium efflux system protein
VELDALERQLITETRLFAEFIDEHVLWIRSAPILTAADLPRALAALGWLFGSGWADVLTALWDDLLTHSILTIPVLLLLAALFVERHRLTRQLRDCSDQAAEARNASYLLTVRSLLCTLGIVLPVPALLLFLGWRLGAAQSGSDLANAIAHALTRTALLLLPLAFFIHICRVRGLGGAHFRWPQGAIEQGRRVAVLWAVTVLPLLFLTVAMEGQPNEAHKASLGRLAFIAAALLTAVVMFALLRRNSPVLAVAAKSTGGVVLWTRWLWFPFILGVPPLLALTAFMGFGFTAVHLFGKLLATFLLLLGLVIVQELILRWVYLVQLRLALEERDRRLQEALEEQRQRAEEEELPEVTAFMHIQEKGVSFGSLRHQTRALLRWGLAGVGLFGLYLIWADVLPALGILEQFVLWGTPVADGGGGQVTVSDLLLAALTVLAAVIAARNLPAVLEMILLRHLPMDSGTRYAATAIVRYAVTAVGVVFVAVFIGISWSSVQWLIAALTVGLGFGLQEIFANFISGLILLFERPIRVGDTVTIGDVIGTVTRIRIRATTITDWERKELVVPNREFITGRLINWTLSDDIIRARVRVGIAYGSNTAKAQELLLQAAGENRRVLDDPPPFVLFEAFGSSSLDFELRVFVRGIHAYRLVHSELNLRIDELFREAGIEIAFPQQDLHIRSVHAPPPLQPPKA